ncbi:Breast cancer type 1 susceptibility protein like protein, partial [Eufriesea mexicana]
GKSGIEKSSLPRARWRKNIEDMRAPVGDEDSPDFCATIDQMKNIRNKMIVSDEGQEIAREESLMQDNLDDIFANVNTDVLVDDYTCEKGGKCKAQSAEYERDIKQKRLDVENVSLSSEELAPICSNSSNKENKSIDTDVHCVSDEDDKTLLSTSTNVSNKSAMSDKLQDKIKPVGASRESTKMNKSLHNSIIFSKCTKLSIPANDSYVKDTYDMDSLMDITQRDMLLRQFEQDLFEKPKSNSSSKKQQKTPQKSRRDKECSKQETEDVEHSGEEDDIVENTPDTKTKNMQAFTSPPGSSIASSISKITVRPFLGKSPSSSTGKRSVSIGMPGCKRNIQPLYQSTPKSQKSTMFSTNCLSRKSLLVANESSSKQTRRNIVRENIDQSVKNAQNVGRQRLCFVCSCLPQFERTEVRRLAEMFNGRYVAQFDRDVTHVIVKADTGNNGANNTLKYLQGIAHRKWIVTYEWVVNSLRERRLVNEEPYEAVDSRTLEAGPRRSRLSEKRLFEGFMFLCIGPYSDVSVEQYRDLVRAAGATVVESLDALAAEKNMLKIIVIQTDIYEYEIIEWFKKAQAVAIVHDWVVECISQYQLISFFPYMQELTRHDVLSLGYPENLVEELEGESESTCDIT